LKPTDNLIVLFEETGGDPTKISLELHYTRTVCSQVSENDYPPLLAWSDQDILNKEVSVSSIPPQGYLHCDDGHVISSITFASYGTPSGSCQKFSQGKCHAANSLSLVTEVSVKTFGIGFCIHIYKLILICLPLTFLAGLSRKKQLHSYCFKLNIWRSMSGGTKKLSDSSRVLVHG
jgi:hypothetical protein